MTMRLDDDELAALARLEADLLATVHEAADGDVASAGALKRLFPDAYPDDDEASAEFRSLTHDDLADAKTDAARRVLAALLAGGSRDTLRRRRRSRHVIPLDEELAQTLLRNLTDMRLLLAERLGIEHDDDRGHPEPEFSADRQQYLWLGSVQESLVQALYGRLDDRR
jgi:hypothetical protein